MMGRRERERLGVDKEEERTFDEWRDFSSGNILKGNSRRPDRGQRLAEEVGKRSRWG
jgi:hypothetical protein